MLLELRLTALATVESLVWEPGAGLNVVSGETGAGKSILVGAVALLFGGKAGGETVRTGARAAVVEGRFDCTAPGSLRTAAEELGAEDASDVVLRREISSDGRSRYQLNGHAIAQAQVRDLGRRVLDMHGQHDHQSLLRVETHMDLLDRFGSHAAALAKEDVARRVLEETRARRTAWDQDREAESARREVWEFQFRELSEARLERPDEDAELERERLRLAHAERLAEAMSEAMAALEEEHAGATARAAAARHALSRVREFDERLGAPVEALEGVAEGLNDVCRTLVGLSTALDADPGRLSEIDDRLDTLRRLKKRHGGSLEAAILEREELRARLAGLERPEEHGRALEAEEARAAKEWLSSRRKLHDLRAAAAGRLSKSLAAEWREVGLPGARFEVRLLEEPGDALHKGWAHAGEFFISTNPGEELRPLARVASGGEISRLMLGLKGALASADPVSTLLFDEIDSGIGGRVAETVAAKLLKLARSHQVLCITHLPALAAAGDRHFMVQKEVRAGRTYTRVAALLEGDRVEELCRMLAGSRVTEATRRQARELLAARLPATRFP